MLSAYGLLTVEIALRGVFSALACRQSARLPLVGNPQRACSFSLPRRFRRMPIQEP